MKGADQNLDDLKQTEKELVVDFQQRVKKVVRLNQDPRMVKAFNEAATEESKAACKLMLDIWKQNQTETRFRNRLRQEIKQILDSRTGMDTMAKMVTEAAQIEESQEKKTRSSVDEVDENDTEDEQAEEKRPKAKNKKNDGEELNAMDRLNKMWDRFQTSEQSERRTQYRGNGRG